jgi:hypothetical protein
MKNEATQNKTVDLRYLKAKYKGGKPANLMGKGKVRFTEGSLFFEGKKLLPNWFVIVLVILCFFMLSNLLSSIIGDILAYGAVPFLWIPIVAFIRLKASVDVRHDSVKAVIEDRSKARFLLVFDSGNKLPHFIAWQTTSDAATLSEEFRKLFPSLIKDEDVKGSKTN